MNCLSAGSFDVLLLISEGPHASADINIASMNCFVSALNDYCLLTIHGASLWFCPLGFGSRNHGSGGDDTR